MLRIDAHQHFWKYDKNKHGWITEDMSVLRKDFLPEDLRPILEQNQIDGCVAVQADQSESETLFLLNCAELNPFVKGVVGWVDLRSKNLKEKLERFSRYKKLKGFRHILQSEEKRDCMLDEDFKLGISLLNNYSFTYDILIYPDQLPYVTRLVEEFPDQKFVIDHLAKPFIKFRKIDEWASDIECVAKHQNVYCKISGFVTEADWAHWTRHEFKLYFDVVTKVFGTDRLMFGSDWPVCLLASDYNNVLNIVETYFSSSSVSEREKLFGRNAMEFYAIN